MEMLSLGNFFGLALQQSMMRDLQLLNLFFPELLPYNITPRDHVFCQNNRTILEFFKQVRAEKLEQIKQGNVGTDLFSILLTEGGEVYGENSSDEELFDDIKLIYFAATNTTQISVNNLLKYIHMDQYKDVKENLLAEIDELIPFNIWDSKHNLINQDKLLEACDYEKVYESFDYTMMCFKESMRLEAPIGFSTAHTVTQDVVLAKGTKKELKVNAGQEIHIMMSSLHHDPAQWGARHNEFIPERFDPDSEHFKAPNGKSRHPYAYAPFFGGHRVCLGKTFAEVVAKKLITTILKFYTLEHANESMKTETHEYEIFQMKLPEIHYKFSKRIV